MNLQTFIEKYKTDTFDYEITDTEVQIKFDIINNQNINFLNVPSEYELQLFSNLLNNRTCRFIGKELINSKLGVIGVYLRF